MDLNLNGNKINTINLSPHHTVGQLKNTIRNIMEPLNVKTYDVTLRFNNGELLSPVVFDTLNYDNVDFLAHRDKINGGIISVTSIPRDKNMFVYFLMDVQRDEPIYSSPSLEKVLKWYVENTIVKRYRLEPEAVTEMGIPYPTDYSNAQHQEAIMGNMGDYIKLYDMVIDLS